MNLGTITERLARNRYELDGVSHIEVDQEAARAAGLGPVLERICPAHVYSVGPDGLIGVLWAACLECGACLAVAPPGVLTWHYPAGGTGVLYRLG
ncbi:MAG: 4Fe-4S dicluster domain-containing protein [Bifidobacteriaceae bacterium]|jgi:ferredoxin like protein|nr:4Fe-4S dicluster domain-containing protein [Bifidobacteriaceae bacterium]